MTPQQQIAAFIDHVTASTGKFTESRSSLKNLLIWLRNPVNHRSRLNNVQAATAHCANPRDSRLTKYNAPLTALVGVWGTTNDYPRSTSSGSSTGGSDNVMELINSVKPQLLGCKDFVCNDVGTFPQCINKKLPTSKQEAIRGKTPKATGLPVTSDGMGGWNARGLKVAHASVNMHQAAECTNYAYYAGHVLSTGSVDPMPRIEIVSWEGRGMAKHCFVVVGRTGPRDSTGKLPPSSTWNREARIVDCWALTLGFDCVYTPANYCYPGMLNPAKIIMDSSQELQEINMASGLKKTGIKLN